MQLNPSSSTQSPSWASRLDPSIILLPIFIGLVRAAPFVPFLIMILGTNFGMSGGREAPNGWWLALLSALGFWCVRLLGRRFSNAVVFNILLLLIGIMFWIFWMAVSPSWHIGEVLSDPLSLVGSNGHFGWTLLITMIFWILTLRLALDEREQSSEGVRGMMVRSLIGVVAMIILAAVIGAEMGEAGLQAGYIALPIALVSGIGAVGLSEMVTTRETARRRGATVPSWNRWGRTFLGSAALVVAITFVASIVFGPGFLDLVVSALATIWSGIATVLIWIMRVVVYGIYLIARFIVWIMNSLFDTSIEPAEMPQIGGEPIEQEPQQEPEGEQEPWKYAQLARFAGIIGLALVALLIISRFVRYRSNEADRDPNEERSSVFSGSLLRDQMRNLFSRRGGGNRPRKLDLAEEPESVRDSMLYLQVLADRLNSPREPWETPQDFTRRLAAEWPELKEPLAEIRNRYEHVRYGESEEDRRAVIVAWNQIWSAQKELPGATG